MTAISQQDMCQATCRLIDSMTSMCLGLAGICSQGTKLPLIHHRLKHGFRQTTMSSTSQCPSPACRKQLLHFLCSCCSSPSPALLLQDLGRMGTPPTSAKTTPWRWRSGEWSRKPVRLGRNHCWVSCTFLVRGSSKTILRPLLGCVWQPLKAKPRQCTN